MKTPLRLLFWMAILLTPFFLTYCDPSQPSAEEDPCPPPAYIGIEKVVEEPGGTYQLSFRWTPVRQALTYRYQFFIEGEVVDRGIVQETGFTVSLTQENIGQQISAQVVCDCSDTLQSEPVEMMYTFMNSVGTSDIVFLIAPGGAKTDSLCNLPDTCLPKYVVFKDGMLIDSTENGIDTIKIGEFEGYHYYPYSLVRKCLCPPNGPAADLKKCLDSILIYTVPLDSLNTCFEFATQ